MTTANKGRVLRGDLALYDGVNATETRRDSTGGMIAGLPFGDSVDVLQLFGDGENRTHLTINQATSILGSRNRTLLFAVGEWAITANTTIASNFTSHIPAGCVFNVAAGVTLTFSGPIVRESDTWTTGSGTVSFSSVPALSSTATTSDGAALVSQKHGGSTGTFTTNAVASTVQEKFDSWVDPVVDFDVPTDGTNARTALQTMFDSVGNNAVIKFPRVDITFDGAVSLASTNNVTIIFEGTKFLMGDTVGGGTFTIGATTWTNKKIGFLFDQCDYLTILGDVKCFGQGSVGSTRLAGFVFAQCDWLDAPAEMHFDTFAAGRLVMHCDYINLGNAFGVRMDGLQVLDAASLNAGTVEVLVGNRWGRSGDVVSISAEKPCRYMSVATGRDNQFLSCGASIASHDGASLTSHALGIRSAVDCTFGPVIVSGGVYAGLFVTQSSGDIAAGYSINRVKIDSVLGTGGSTGASVDALVSVTSQESTQIGDIYIGCVKGTVSGETGIANSAAKLTIGSCELTGSATRLISTYSDNNGWEVETRIGDLTFGTHTGSEEPVSIGNGAYFSCENLNITTGPSTASVSIAVFYNNAFGSSTDDLVGIHIGRIRYTQNGSSQNYSYLVYNATSTAGPAKMSVYDVPYSDAATGDMLLGSSAYSARQGTLLGAAAPTTGTWRVGDQVWDITPVTAQPMGWVCSAAGNPGTWLSMASFA